MKAMRATIVGSAQVAPDLEIHVRTLTWKDGSTLAEIRNYVPSNGTYGRGIIIPPEALRAVRAALGKVYS